MAVICLTGKCNHCQTTSRKGSWYARAFDEWYVPDLDQKAIQPGFDVQVGRRQDPLEDAAAVVAIRAAVGPGVRLRADANRLWTLEQALQFALAAESADLEVHHCAVASS